MSEWIQFFTEDTGFEPANPNKLEKIIHQVVDDHEFQLDSIHLIILNDQELRAINKEFLDHDYFTDVISFNLAENENEVAGEIYISIDRIKENAEFYEVSVQEEFERVVVHGSLHLVGYSDYTAEAKANMHKLEDHYLSLEFK